MDYAETFTWGKNRGCDFFSCIDEDSREFFNVTGQKSCTFYHFGKGRSDIDSFSDICRVSLMS